MLKRWVLKNSLVIIVMMAIFLSFNPLINAQTEAQAKDEGQTDDRDDAFRQRLGSLVTSEEEKEEQFPSEAQSFIRYIPTRSVNAMSGSVGIIESEAEYNYEFKAFGKIPIQFGIGTEYIGIQNSLTEVELPANLTGLSTGVRVILPFLKFSNTYLATELRPSFYSTDWIFRTSSFRMPIHSFAIYKPSDKFMCILGIGIYPDYEDNVVPIAGFVYKPNERLSFNIMPTRPTITYALNDKIDLFAALDMVGSEFEVIRDKRKKVILKYDETCLGGGAIYKLNRFIQASVSTGGVLGRRLEYRDSVGKVAIKNNFYTEFRLEMAM